MEISQVLITILVTVAILLPMVIWILRKNLPQNTHDKTFQSFLQLQQELHNLHSGLQEQIRSVSGQLADHARCNTRFLQDSQQNYREVMGDVQHRLGVLQSATQSMVDIGKDISSLQDILRAPKLRGGMGEFLLAELLRQILPDDHFSLQHRFKNGAQVDAVIRLGDGLVPVDAKFPLENFRRILESDASTGPESRKAFWRDIKKHVDDISSKYILPEEGTFEFALMYIPSENIYYETIIRDESQNESISDYAIRHKVIPVSPNSFYAYLQAMVRGLKGMRIERSAQIILENLGQLEVSLGQCLSDFEKIGIHLGHARASYEKTELRFRKLQNKLNAMGDGQGALKDAGPRELEIPADETV